MYYRWVFKYTIRWIIPSQRFIIINKMHYISKTQWKMTYMYIYQFVMPGQDFIS